MNFENLNYTIITSRCRGPKYPSNICCVAFRDLACPYATQLNDPNNNCATTMFSYIKLYSKYPPGLFANECRDSKRGLESSQSQSSPAASTSATAALSLFHRQSQPLLFILSAATFLPIFKHLLWLRYTYTSHWHSVLIYRYMLVQVPLPPVHAQSFRILQKYDSLLPHALRSRYAKKARISI